MVSQVASSAKANEACFVSDAWGINRENTKLEARFSRKPARRSSIFPKEKAGTSELLAYRLRRHAFEPGPPRPPCGARPDAARKKDAASADSTNAEAASYLLQGAGKLALEEAFCMPFSNDRSCPMTGTYERLIGNITREWRYPMSQEALNGPLLF